MIPRTLVPTDVRPVTDNGDKRPPRRLSTYMDDRTVVPSELSDHAAPLDGKTTIPAHLPLGVLVDRTLVSRSMPAKAFESFGPITEYPSIDILDSRVVVPAYVEPPEQRDIERFNKPQQMTAELRELVEPDIFNTGEANLLVEPEEKRDAKEDLITRALSIAFHIGFIIFLIFLPKFFRLTFPRRKKPLAASKELGVVYLPSDVPSVSKAPPSEPGPKVRISPEDTKSCCASAAGIARHRSASRIKSRKAADGFAFCSCSAHFDKFSNEQVSRHPQAQRRRHACCCQASHNRNRDSIWVCRVLRRIDSCRIRFEMQ